MEKENIVKKLLVKLGEIPNYVLNLISILAFLITIFTPIIGFYTVTHYETQQPLLTIYIITVIVLFAMLVIVYRYYYKHRRLYTVSKKVSSEHYRNLTRQFRNTYYDIQKCRNDSQNKLSAELLTTKVESFLKQTLDSLCEIMENHTLVPVCACVMYIEGPYDGININNATVRTLTRSSNTDPKRSEYDNSAEKIYIKDNSNLLAIVNPIEGQSKSYVYIPDLLKHKNDVSTYNDKSPNWEEFYKSIIVVPIDVANKRIFFTEEEDGYEVLAFLCIDANVIDAFAKKEEKYYCDIACGFAHILYLTLNKYKYYLKEIDKGGSDQHHIPRINGIMDELQCLESGLHINIKKENAYEYIGRSKSNEKW